ncbi:MAG: heavy-metal-associated domain-containing protein [Leptonema sp. (in: bacteria)]
MKVVIGVDGMTCRHCEMSVEKAIMNLKGVEKVSANHKEKKVEIEYRNPNLTLEDFYNTVEETGYVPIRN